MKERLEKELQECEAEVTDISDGCGASFEVRVCSPELHGLKLVQKHKRVHSALGNDIFSQLHALRIASATSPNEQ